MGDHIKMINGISYGVGLPIISKSPFNLQRLVLFKGWAYTEMGKTCNGIKDKCNTWLAKNILTAPKGMHYSKPIHLRIYLQNINVRINKIGGHKL